MTIVILKHKLQEWLVNEKQISVASLSWIPLITLYIHNFLFP